MKQKKNVVVMSTMYYPDMGAPSAVIDKYIKALSCVCNFYYITKTYKEHTEFVNKENVLYISSIWHKLLMFCNKNQNKVVVTIILAFINVHKLLMTQICNPNANSWESSSYYNVLENLHSKKKIDCVISVSNTVFTQFAAMRFKKKHPNIRWVNFVTDPYTTNYVYYRYKLFKGLWNKLFKKTEKSFYLHADVNLMCPEMYEYARSALSIPLSKLVCMNFTLNEEYKDFSSNVHANEKVKFVYAGAVYRDIRNPQFMLNTISQITNSVTDLFIKKGECEDMLINLPKNINRYEFVSSEEYGRMICEKYDILLSIGNRNTIQFPSKTLDLISTGKPIINFYFEKKSQYEMIEQYPLGINIAEGDLNAKSVITNFCQKFKGKRLSFETIKCIFPQNIFENQLKTFKNNIDII